MREIKFRGKRIEDGVWVYGSLLQDYWSSRYQKRVTAIVYPGCVGERDNRDIVDPATVGQYTGYSAKSGSYIFEGDIVTRGAGRWGYRHSKGQIRYGTRMMGFGIYSCPDKYGPPSLLAKGIGGVVIVGNIHDTPDNTQS